MSDTWFFDFFGRKSENLKNLGQKDGLSALNGLNVEKQCEKMNIRTKKYFEKFW